MRLGGKVKYDDKFNHLQENEMATNIVESGSKSPKWRDHGNLLLEAESDDNRVQAWDDSISKEAERVIKSMRLKYKDSKDKVQQLQDTNARLESEAEVMQQLFLERKLVAEQALAMSAKLQSQLGSSRSNATNQDEHIKIPERKKLEIVVTSSGNDDDGFSSWREDRARLGQKVEDIEKENASLRSSDLEAQNLIIEANKKLEQRTIDLISNQEINAKMSIETAEMKKSLEGMSSNLSDANLMVTNTNKKMEEMQKLDTQRKKLDEEVMVKSTSNQNEITALLEKTNKQLNSQVEELKKTIITREQDISEYEQHLDDIQQDMGQDEGNAKLLAQYTDLTKVKQDLQNRLREKEETILSQAKSISDKLNHISKLDALLEEKNAFNSEQLSIIESIEKDLNVAQESLHDKDNDLIKLISNLEEEQIAVVTLKENINLTDASHASTIVEKDLKIEMLKTDCSKQAESIVMWKDNDLTKTAKYTNEITALDERYDTLQADMKNAIAIRDAEIYKQNGMILDWEKKMSLFEILQEYETNAKKKEIETVKEIKQFQSQIHKLNLEKDGIQKKSKYLENCLEFAQQDYLLDAERDLVLQLKLNVEKKNEKITSLNQEILAINKARELELIDFEKKSKLEANGVIKQLRDLMTNKTIEHSVLNSIITSLKTYADSEILTANNIISNKSEIIANLDLKNIGLEEELQGAHRAVFDKESELVRALAEISDHRIREYRRKGDLMRSSGDALESYKTIVSAKASSRAPRLKLQQMEKIIIDSEQRAALWEIIAKEYILDKPSSYHSINNDGYQISLSLLDGNIHGVGILSVMEQTLAAVANNLVLSSSVTKPSLSSLRQWINMNDLDEEMETRALKSVLLSWAGLEAMCELPELLATRIEENSSNSLPSKNNGIEIIVTDLNLKNDSLFGTQQKKQLEQRLFILFEEGNVTTAEFRIMNELKHAFSCQQFQIESILDAIGLPLNVLTDRVIIDFSDQHELKMSRDICYDLKILLCVLTSYGMNCKINFITKLKDFHSEMEKALKLRESYVLLRKSYNQACTQMSLLREIPDSARDMLNARNSGRNSSRKVVHSSIGDNKMHSSMEVSDAIAEKIRSALKSEIQEERRRRHEEALRRRSDAKSAIPIDERNSKLLHRSDHNLTALEFQLAERGHEIDKARMVFVKMLRNQLCKESSVKIQNIQMLNRVSDAEASSEQYLQSVEEAMATLGIEGDAHSAVTMMMSRQIKDLQGEISESNSRLENILDEIHELRDIEVANTTKTFRDLEMNLNFLQKTENNADKFEKKSSGIANELQRKAEMIRQKDSVLERLLFLSNTVSADLIDRQYKLKLADIRKLFDNLEYVDEKALGKQNLSHASFQWDHSKVISLDTRLTDQQHDIAMHGDTNANCDLFITENSVISAISIEHDAIEELNEKKNNNGKYNNIQAADNVLEDDAKLEQESHQSLSIQQKWSPHKKIHPEFISPSQRSTIFDEHDEQENRKNEIERGNELEKNAMMEELRSMKKDLMGEMKKIKETEKKPVSEPEQKKQQGGSCNIM